MNQGLVGHRLRGVAAGNPQGLDAPGVDGVKQLNRGQAIVVRQLLDAPVTRHFFTVLAVAGVAVARKQIAQAAGFPSTHGIGLAGEGERPGAGPADLPGGQVQVDQGAVLGAAAARLVEAHAPQGQKARRAADQARAGLQVGHRDATQFADHLRGVVAHQGLEGIEAFGVLVDKAPVDPAFPHEDMQQAVEQGHVGAGLQGQVQVGQFAGVGAPRIDDDDAHFRALGLGFFQAAKQHRMGIGHVRTGDQQAVGLLDVLVVARRRIGTQAALVAGHSRGHAQPRVAIDVVGADHGAGQLVKGVVILGQQLAGDIEGHAVRAMLADGFGEHIGGVIEGVVPVRA